jgi:hypothetical protein
MKKIFALAMFLNSVLVFCQPPSGNGNCNNQSPRYCTDQQTISTSGSSIKIPSNGGLVASFEEVITGAPSTISIVIQGCSPTVVCETIDTYTSVANSIRAPAIAKAYTYYTITATWTGGSNVGVRVNTMITSARTGPGAGSSSSGGIMVSAKTYLTCDDATDDTGNFNAMLAALYTTQGNTVYFPAGCVALVNSAEITLPNDGASPPHQPSIRLTGAGGPVNGYWGTVATYPVSGLDLQYNAPHAKLVTLGAGKLEIDHMFIKDGGSDCAPFIFTTNTELMIHDVTFSGTASGTAACNDAIILGGDTNLINGLVTGAFQGYGTTIERNFFDRIRAGVTAKAFVNSIWILNNTFSTSSGSSAGGAIVFNNSQGPQSGNKILGNTIEATNYKYGIYLVNSASGLFVENLIQGNDCWDTNGTTIACVQLNSGNTNNLIMPGFLDGGSSAKPVIDSNSAPSNPIYDYFGYMIFGQGHPRFTANFSGPTWGQGTVDQWTLFDINGDFYMQDVVNGDYKLHCVPGASGGGYCEYLDMLWASNNLEVGWAGSNTFWDAWGGKHERGNAPTVSAGTITGSNAAGIISGLSAATSVVLTFNTNGPWTSWQSCTASPSVSLAAAPYVSAISQTSVTFTFPSLTGKLYYQCGGN